ncbi:Pisatin demethylase 1 [Colletotrichum chlorophyti]|uniref:Pisatin demethylase 1 n=1 Tax=Colletotrichum chlorophyti TaxID=708187 RepID=A0A1Q8RU95_9PEZI|nr:Pisatin demethylase 1 [Colletotrichum chlorophyti]
MAVLSLTNGFLLFLAYVVWKLAYQIVYYRVFHPLSVFPGPFWGSVTRLWITYHNVKEDECQVFQGLHEKYGPVIRITPTMLLVSDAKKLPEIYHRNANKSQHYITGSFGKTESLFNMQDHAVHARFRKIAAAPYSFSNIRKMEPLLDRHIERWVRKLDDFARTDARVDFAPWAVYLVYDIVSEVGFGEPFGFIEQGKDVEGLIQGFHDGLVPFGILARCYPFTNWVKSTFLGKYLVASPEQQSGIGTLMRFRDRLIAQRFEDIEKGTTNGRYAEVQQHCPYYVACIRESMRLNPSAPNIFPRLAGKGGMEFYGKHVPEGTEVTCNPWLVHRDENVYGPCVGEFRPERWLESEEKTKEMLKYSMAFGYGSRVCLGRDLAMMELFKAPLQFFRTFKPEVINKDLPGRYLVKGGVSFFQDMWIKIARRPKVL